MGPLLKPAHRFRRLANDSLRIEEGERARPPQDAAVDDDRVDVGGLREIHQGVCGIEHRGDVEVVGAHKNEVRPFARREGADPVRDAEVARARPSVGADALSGIRYVLRSPILPLVLGIEACLNVFGSNSALVTIFARDVLGVGAQGFGLLLAGQGAGAILGTAALVLAGDVRRKGLVMIGAGSVYAAAMVSFAWSRSFQLSVAGLVNDGVADMVAANPARLRGMASVPMQHPDAAVGCLV